MQSLDRELSQRLAKNQPDDEGFGLETDVRERIRATVASLLDVVIQIKEDIENTESEESVSFFEEEQNEPALPYRTSYPSKRYQASKTYQPQAMTVEVTQLYYALHSVLDDWTRDEVQRLVKAEMSKAYQQLKVDKEREEVNEDHIMSPKSYKSSVYTPDVGVNERSNGKDFQNAGGIAKQRKNDFERPRNDIDQQKQNHEDAPLNWQSNLLEDRQDIMQLIFSISEIEASGDQDELGKKAYYAQLQQFIAQKIAANKREQPERISTFSQTEQTSEAQHQLTPADIKGDSVLFLTNQQPKYEAVQELDYNASETKTVNDTRPPEAQIAYLSRQEVDSTMNFNYIDQAYFRKILCKSPHAAANCQEKLVSASYTAKNEEKNLRSSKTQKAANSTEKEQRRQNAAHWRDAKAYDEKYSRKVYELKTELEDKKMRIEKLQAQIASTKCLASSYYYTNATLKKQLEQEQQNRLSIEAKMLKVKQQYELRLYKERSQIFRLNNHAAKFISYIQNDGVRNSLLGASEVRVEKEEPAVNAANPAPEDLLARSEVVAPPLPLREAELSLSTHPHLKRMSIDAGAGSAIASLVDQLYVQTISEDVRSRLSREQQSAIKTNLHEQLVKAFNAQGKDISLHFTPVKIEQPEKQQQYVPMQKSPTPRAYEIKMVDPPHSLNSSVTIPLSLMSQDVQYMERQIASTVYIKEPAKQAQDPYVQLSDEIHNSVPPKIQLEPQSESSDISRLSKVRVLKIKQYGEIGCLLLLNIDEEKIQDGADMELLDFLKELSGSIPSIPDFQSVPQEKIQVAARILSVLGSSYVSILLRTILFLVLFVYSGAIPNALRLKMAETAGLIAGFTDLESKIAGYLLNLVISTEYLIELKKTSDLQDSVRSSQAAAFTKNLKSALSSLNVLAQTIAFNPLRTCQSVVYYSCIRRLRLEGAGGFDIWNSFAIAASWLASKTQSFGQLFGAKLLSYQVVNIGCLALVFIEIGGCEMDAGTQRECTKYCQELIRSCTEITKIPGFENVVNH